MTSIGARGGILEGHSIVSGTETARIPRRRNSATLRAWGVASADILVGHQVVSRAALGARAVGALGECLGGGGSGAGKIFLATAVLQRMGKSGPARDVSTDDLRRDCLSARGGEVGGSRQSAPCAVGHFPPQSPPLACPPTRPPAAPTAPPPRNAHRWVPPKLYRRRLL